MGQLSVFAALHLELSGLLFRNYWLLRGGNAPRANVGPWQPKGLFHVNGFFARSAADNGVGRITVNYVIAGLAQQSVLAGLAEERVIASTGREAVVATSAVQCVITAIALQGIVAVAAIEKVIAAATNQLVIARASDKAQGCAGDM